MQPFNTQNYIKTSSENKRDFTLYRSMGRTCFFHPCVLKLETTRTTDKNNSSFRRETFAAFLRWRAAARHNQELFQISCFPYSENATAKPSFQSI
jgi:hypothetical protein